MVKLLLKGFNLGVFGSSYFSQVGIDIQVKVAEVIDNGMI